MNPKTIIALATISAILLLTACEEYQPRPNVLYLQSSAAGAGNTTIIENNFTNNITNNITFNITNNVTNNITTLAADFSILLDAGNNLTNYPGLTNTHENACQNITGATSNLCTLVDTNTGTTNAHLHSALNITGTLSDGQIANASFWQSKGSSNLTIANIVTAIGNATAVNLTTNLRAQLNGTLGFNFTNTALVTAIVQCGIGGQGVACSTKGALQMNCTFNRLLVCNGSQWRNASQ